jgi:Tol biopolymer transport system component
LALTDRNSAEEPWAIYLLSLNTGAKRRLLDPVQASPGDSGPVFSPNGRQIAFRRSESIGNNDIYTVSVAGGKPRRVTYDKRFTSAHAWTRDGMKLYLHPSARALFLCGASSSPAGRRSQLPVAPKVPLT